jgi:methylenetetrahydrofolate dehydrogenase (NADP+) / methenyltetrahydrofolate cyclohydrolase
MAKLLSGEKIAEKILRRIKRQRFVKKPKLIVVQVGSNAVSSSYIREKEKAAKLVGIEFELLKHAKGTSQVKVKEEIFKVSRNPHVSGLVVQLPLPAKFQWQEIVDEIPEEKDADLLSSAAFGRFALAQSAILPPTVRAIALLLEENNIAVQGKRVVVIGAGRLVGLPLALWLLRNNATVTVANEYTRNLASLTKEADILVSGAGKPGLVRSSMVKKGAVVIDAGTSAEKGGIRGDVDFNRVIHKARYITPVPGGVGPLTVACLLENVVHLAKTTPK